MNWKAFSRRRPYSYYNYNEDHCAKKGCVGRGTFRANIMLGKVPTWIYSCATHREEWP